MNTNMFDARIGPADGLEKSGARAEVHFGKIKSGADLTFYAPAAAGGGAYCGLTAGLKMDIKWHDSFELRLEPGGVREGLCLWPGAPDGKALKPAKRADFLARLAGGEKDMLAVCAEVEGVKGLREETLADFCRLRYEELQEAAVALESEGKVLILSFAPLFLVNRTALDRLKEKILPFIAAYHEKHPERIGVTEENLGKKFPAHVAILKLAVRSLVKEGRLASAEGVLAAAGFRPAPSEEDKQLYTRLEDIIRKGEMVEARIEDVRAELDLSPWKVQAMLENLVERKRILRTDEGFYLHSDWLQKLIADIRASGRKELSVSDFKAMTGLSRKFAIPLLELLDQMGVTRRKGSGRAVIPGPQIQS